MRGHQAGRDSGLWTLDPVRSAQPRTVSGPSPRSTLRTAATSPWGRNTQSAVSTHTHILDSSTPRARGGGQAPRHILYVPCPLGGGGISVPTLYMRKLEPGGGEACSRSLSQGAVKRGPEVWRVSHKSLQTRFLQLPPPPPDQCLGPDQKASAAALSDVRGSPGGGGQPLCRLVFDRSPGAVCGAGAGLSARQAVWTLPGALAAGSRLRSVSSWAGGRRGGTEAWLTPSPCLMWGEARPREGGTRPQVTQPLGRAGPAPSNHSLVITGAGERRRLPACELRVASSE